MKEKIYTIPITEVFEKETFCPFCDLYQKLETEAVKYAVGPAMMEPDFRALTNRKGFCKKHIADIESESKALALSLMLKTHLETLSAILDKEITESKKKMFSKQTTPSSLDGIANEIDKTVHACTICDKINHSFDRYVDTFFHLIATEESFRQVFRNTGGFCFEHFSLLLNEGKHKLKEGAYLEFSRQLIANQKEKMEKHYQNILDFIDQFDYRNANKPPKAPRDTVYQCCKLLNGVFEQKQKKLEDI